MIFSNVAMGDRAEFLWLAKKISPVVKMEIVGRMSQPYSELKCSRCQGILVFQPKLWLLDLTLTLSGQLEKFGLASVVYYNPGRSNFGWVSDQSQLTDTTL